MDKEKQEKHKALQQRYLQLQMIDQQMKQLQSQAQMLENQIQEIDISVESLNELEKIKTSAEILTPVCPGIYAKASLKENKKLIVNVGAGIAVEKNFDESRNILQKQLDEMRTVQADMINNIQELARKALMIDNEAEKLLAEVNK